MSKCRMFIVFFFQAEDGIRDIGVTGVQTCALPISHPARPGFRRGVDSWADRPEPERREGGAFAVAEREPKKEARRSGGRTTAGDSGKGFTDEEQAAMRERAQELKAEARRGGRASKADGESDLLAKIAEMPQPDRAMAERLHAIVMANAPSLTPRTWYGMPAYAKDGKVVCFYQSADKFKARYATFGFSDKANLDEGAMWPTSFALKELTATEEARIVALVKKAVS